MRVFVLAVLAGLMAGCANSYWARPGATLPDLVSESEGCYRASLGFEAPSPLPGPGGGPRLLPRTAPPPKLWQRPPRQAAFESFDEQLRYERCMHARGWEPARTSAPTL
jgi:hypothetical protein